MTWHQAAVGPVTTRQKEVPQLPDTMESKTADKVGTTMEWPENF